MPLLRRYLPEIFLSLLAAFFFTRELGTFPATWVDEGLFVTVAKMLATGNGYAIPLFDQVWHYPYFLNVGPLLIVPSGISMAIFGISLEAARLPMVLYLAGATALLYLVTKNIHGRTAACWATALLITFSGFVNTGKPVLGEVPAFFFLLGGLLLLGWSAGWKRSIGSGVLFGLALMTKITFGLILPALGLAWIWALWKRRWSDVKTLTLSGVATVATFAPWRITEMLHTSSGSLTEQAGNFLAGDDGSALFSVLRYSPEVLLRLPYLAFGVFLILGCIGLWKSRGKADTAFLIVTGALIAFFTLYFLNGYGWYRLLLPGHLLLLPFVPAGMRTVAGNKMAAIGLAVIVVLQGWWQLDHRGSDSSLGPRETAAYVEKEYANRALLIGEPEIFAQLALNPLWELVVPNVTFSLTGEYDTIKGDRCRIPFLRKISAENIPEYKPEQLQPISGRYYIVHPPYPCPLRNI